MKKEFIEYCDIKAESIEEGKLYVDIKPCHMNPYNMVHGGLIYTLADTAMGVSISNIHKYVTVSCNINYIIPGKCKRLHTEVKKIRIGNKIAYLDCKVIDENNNLISTASGVYANIDK